MQAQQQPSPSLQQVPAVLHQQGATLPCNAQVLQAQQQPPSPSPQQVPAALHQQAATLPCNAQVLQEQQQPPSSSVQQLLAALHQPVCSRFRQLCISRQQPPVVVTFSKCSNSRLSLRQAIAHQQATSTGQVPQVQHQLPPSPSVQQLPEALMDEQVGQVPQLQQQPPPNPSAQQLPAAMIPEQDATLPCVGQEPPPSPNVKQVPQVQQQPPRPSVQQVPTAVMYEQVANLPSAGIRQTAAQLANQKQLAMQPSLPAMQPPAQPPSLVTGPLQATLQPEAVQRAPSQIAQAGSFLAEPCPVLDAMQPASKCLRNCCGGARAHGGGLAKAPAAVA